MVMFSLKAIGASEEREALGDVIFVHGLGGDPQGSWQIAGKEGSFWPAWLADDFPQLAVYSLGYPAAWTGWLGSSMRISEAARGLLTRLEEGGLGRRPLAFITHSLGGLVTLEMLRIADSYGTPPWRAILAQTQAVIFLGTPLAGARLATYVRALAKIAQLKPVVAQLETNAEILREIVLWYRNSNAGKRISTHVFFETQKTHDVHIVEQGSADPGLPGVIPLPIDADHIALSKPEDRESLVYARSKSILQQYLLDNPVLQSNIGDIVRARAEQLISAFEPRDIPRVERVSQVGGAKIRESVLGPITRAIVITAPGGYGKTVLLGEIYASMRDVAGWVGLLRAQDILVPARPEDLGKEFGRALTGQPTDLLDIADALSAGGIRGLLLIDTLDRILDGALFPALHELLASLIERNVTLVIACRDYEFRAILDPLPMSMPRLAETSHVMRLEVLDTHQVKSVVEAYVARRTDIASELRTRFVEATLNLRFENHQLGELLRIPLLLSMLCKLYGPDGYIPADLTVSRLWEDYWRQCIRQSARKQGADKAADLRETTCYLLAGELFSESSQYLLQFLHEHRIDLNARSVSELLSQGVLLEEESSRIGFFHQTLLEYAIARWLLSHHGRSKEAEILALLYQPRTPHAQCPNFIWPIVRQYVAICEPHRCEQIIDSLDWANFSALRAVAFGVVARTDLELIGILTNELLSHPEHQRLFIEAISTVQANLVPQAWAALLRLLEEGEERNAEVAMEALAELTSRSGASAGPLVEQLLALLDNRAFLARNRDLNFLMARYLHRLADGDFEPDLSVLQALANAYKRFSAGVQALVLSLHLSDLVPDEAKLALFQKARLSIATDEIQPLLVSLGCAVGSHLDGLEAMATATKTGWDRVWAKILAAGIFEDSTRLGLVLSEFSRTPGKRQYRYALLLTEVAAGPGAKDLFEIVERVPLETVLGDGSHIKMISELIEAWSRTLAPPVLARLKAHTETLWEKDSRHLLAARLCISDGSEAEWEAISFKLQKLSDAQFRQVVLRFLHHCPDTVLFALSSKIETLIRQRPKRLGDVLALLYMRWATRIPDATKRLMVIALDDAEAAASAAGNAILNLVKNGHNIEAAEIAYLATTDKGSVLQHWADALLEIADRRPVLDVDIIHATSAVLAPYANHQTKISIIRLVRSWVRANQRVPSPIVAPVAKMVEQGVTDQNVYIGYITALKAMAEFANEADLPMIEHLIALIFTKVDLDWKNDAEHEMADAIRALGRRGWPVLDTLVAQSDFETLPWRNFRALAFAARYLEGDSSPTLQLIERDPRCPATVKAAIARARMGA